MIQPGSKLAHYEVVSALGKGGMGEVWRAKDTKLGREVAIKTLPGEFAEDTDRLARFEREAKLLASLNHPNIAAIHGFEEDNGTHFLVMELVEGDTLADRVGRGAIPVEASLKLAVQIAEALEAAHEKGVIHRDLKPANVKITDDDKVKVLDFGLAKALVTDVSLTASNSPTISMAATGQGVILGTAAYMSPEQARGQEVDKRADIWAFGCVLYEALVGRPTWTGTTATDIIAAAVATEPDFSALPGDLHPDLGRVLTRCLEKDARKRFRDIGDVRIELEAILESPEPRFSPAAQPSHSAWGRTAVFVAGAMLLGSALSFLYQARSNSAGGSFASGQAGIASEIALADENRLAVGTRDYDYPLIALSPDGNWLVFVGLNDEEPMLYRQNLREFEEPELIPGTEDAAFAFFSPDGEWVGFLTANRVKRVALSGEGLRTLGTVTTAVYAGWTRDGWIYFGDDEGLMIRRVPADGSASQPEDVMRLPGSLSYVMPDGRFALATAPVGIDSDYSDIVQVDLQAKTITTLPVSGYAPHWIPTGHLVFVRGSDVLATSFDPESAAVGEDPVTVLTNVVSDSLFSQSQFTVSASGTLAYVPGVDSAIGLITMIDRQSQEVSVLPEPPAKYGALDLSPDDALLAVHMADVEDYIWIYDFDSSQGRKLLASEMGANPKWSLDATELAFTALADSGYDVMVQTLGSASPPQQILNLEGTNGAVSDWSVDGVLAVHNYPIRRGFLPLSDPESTEWIEKPGVVEWGTVFSTDGNWVAYDSDETGQFEIWVSSYPEGDRKEQLSTSGAWEPVWCPCGEIFFRGFRNDWSAARVTVDPELDLEAPQPVFVVENFMDTPGRSYDISSDGQTLFVVQQAQPATDNRIRVKGNWFEELKEQVPVP